MSSGWNHPGNWAMRPSHFSTPGQSDIRKPASSSQYKYAQQAISAMVGMGPVRNGASANSSSSLSRSSMARARRKAISSPFGSFLKRRVKRRFDTEKPIRLAS
ncbi:hypothetical protein P3M64_00875 [Varunaivibrio sulfuroxidans]|nr:hypothetical protein [Varunaivibrio sulfuroxidans]WES30961.1 hypothetical protein P3M64_00875 [Varunaivibrio sulfuroxidans]